MGWIEYPLDVPTRSLPYLCPAWNPPHMSARALCIFLIACISESGRADTVPSYNREILPLLTRLGCNQGACHGKGAGQNGFRLSLRGYAPEQDHAWLTKEFMARRTDRAFPEESLFLRKACGLAPHEGGKLFSVGSRAYAHFAKWIEAGMPGPDSKEAPLQSLEIQPASAVMQPGKIMDFTAMATFADGSKKDVTWLCKFDSNDSGMLDCSKSGQARALRPGITAIRSAYGSEVATSAIRIPYTKNIVNGPVTEQPTQHPIDKILGARLKSLGLPTSAICDDYTFLRRSTLDATGLLPTQDQIRIFFEDKSPERRAAYIDQLLQSSAFVDRWTLFLADLLQNRKERDHDVRGTQGVRSFHSWLREKVIADTPWDQITKEVLTATGSVKDSPQVGYYLVTVGEYQDPTRSEIAASSAQAFLGIRIGCAQCHNHPLERYTQDDYYHYAGFFSRLKLDRKEPEKGLTHLIFNQADSKPGTNQPRTGQFLAPQPLDRSKTTFEKDSDPRKTLAIWMIGPARNQLASAMANRIWRELFGRGLVEPVDDLRATNPPVDPELFNLLAKELDKGGMSIRHLVRFVMNSQTYQRSSTTLPDNSDDFKLFSHYPARRLPAEQLLDAIGQVTGIPDTFPGYPLGIRAQQIPDPTFPSYFLKVFGRSERVTACACEREGEVTLPQLLHLQNNVEIQAKIRNSQGVLKTAMAKKIPSLEIARALHQSALCRPMDPKVLLILEKELASNNPEDVLADLLWALLNSKEFAFQH